MNKYIKEFFHRGLMFSGFGPLITGIIYITLSCTIKDFSLTGPEVFKAILTTYLIAFIQAGISVITIYDKISKVHQSIIQGITIYIIYLCGYLINSWLPLKPTPIIIFSSCFIGGFILIWIIIYVFTKRLTNNLNKGLEKFNQ